MVFSSIPAAYLDPFNWQQQQQQQQHPSCQPAGSSGGGGLNPHPHHLQPPPPPPAQHGPVRPRSMVERARLANIPMPESALKCPRCESTNTKFCYFNNYNLLQPRHFCKACRRYWTRGGALRSVPVGGGCRRNKRTKSSCSKKGDKRSATSASGGHVSDNSRSSSMVPTSVGLVTGTTAELLGLASQIPQLGFIAPTRQTHSHHPGEFPSNKIGLSYGEVEGISGDLNFQFVGVGEGNNNNGSVRNSLLSTIGTGGIEQWRVQQFPYMGNQDMQAGIYPTYESEAEQPVLLSKLQSSVLASQPASTKTENGKNNSNNNNQVELNRSRRMDGIQGSGHPFWGTSGISWTDHSGFSSFFNAQQ